MSTIRANSITNSAGSGAPDFPNGITAATIPAANLTGTLPAIDGSALTNLPAPTTAQVGTATAGLAVSAVGSYHFVYNGTVESVIYNPGDTIAGSNLYSAGLNYSGSSTVENSAQAGWRRNTTTLSGTWRIMGFMRNTDATTDVFAMTLALRIS